ncbi:hypothetical protein NCC78_00805 [Micromonospora phytophila]|uniref:hypothetical protein n=1 Tax=Micromonospora phytophila TaxID=709888 RepID=UPI0020308FD3|nr:hypothetical protein [Micromonospora phytophila]MCM0673276.1 hypothetical protein [Micromonospora phytophila]
MEILRHEAGLAARPPVRYTLRVAGSAHSPCPLRPLWTVKVVSKRWRATHGDAGGNGPGGEPAKHVRQGNRKPYVFRGLIHCAGDAYSRCRFLQKYALANQVEHPGNVCLREDALTDPLDTWLASAFAPHRIEPVITAMVDAQPLEQPPAAATAARTIITRCDIKPQRNRAHDAGADPAVVTGCIARTERARAEADLPHQRATALAGMSRAENTSPIEARCSPQMRKIEWSAECLRHAPRRAVGQEAVAGFLVGSVEVAP